MCCQVAFSFIITNPGPCTVPITDTNDVKQQLTAMSVTGGFQELFFCLVKLHSTEVSMG